MPGYNTVKNKSFTPEGISRGVPTNAVSNSPELDSRTIRMFREDIWNHFQEHGRSLPWRNTEDPYRILVSEIMLQQTQVERVLGKYEHFVSAFPDFASLAEAHFSRVLELWQGLGYNRRAKALQQTARKVIDDYSGTLPDCQDTLKTFPGIGAATAGAIAAFAFRKPVVFIETNIRRVFIHNFFPECESVRDNQILPLIELTLDTCKIREWYYALMDYGVMLKQTVSNPNRRSAHYSVQSSFQGSDRQIRGNILKLLVKNQQLSEQDLCSALNEPPERVRGIVDTLVREGFLDRNGTHISIADIKERRK